MEYSTSWKTAARKVGRETESQEGRYCHQPASQPQPEPSNRLNQIHAVTIQQQQQQQQTKDHTRYCLGQFLAPPPLSLHWTLYVPETNTHRLNQRYAI